MKHKILALLQIRNLLQYLDIMYIRMLTLCAGSRSLCRMRSFFTLNGHFWRIRTFRVRSEHFCRQRTLLQDSDLLQTADLSCRILIFFADSGPCCRILIFCRHRTFLAGSWSFLQTADLFAGSWSFADSGHFCRILTFLQDECCHDPERFFNVGSLSKDVFATRNVELYRWGLLLITVTRHCTIDFVWISLLEFVLHETLRNKRNLIWNSANSAQSILRVPPPPLQILHFCQQQYTSDTFPTINTGLGDNSGRW